MKKFLIDYGELLGDILIILFGVILIYIFFTIEMQGRYAVENNAIILWLEQYMGFPIILIGVALLIADIREKMGTHKKKKRKK